MDIFFGPQAVGIPSGTATTPGVAVPSSENYFEAEPSRKAWPGVVTLELQASFDGSTWVTVMAAPIAPYITNPKDSGITAAIIGFGWGATKPQKVRARITSPSAFSSTVTVRGQ